MNQFLRYFLIPLLFLFVLFTVRAQAQITEPDLVETQRNISALGDNYNSGIGLNVIMNNFGFGIGGDFRKVIGPQTELSFSLRLTGIRDESEQTFTDIFFGQQIVPNKFQRAFAAPLLVGLRYRVLPDLIQDDYRFFVSVAAGPSLALTIPYFNDVENLGYRFTGSERVLIDEQLFRLQPSPVNDIFSGWSQGEFHWGGAGEFKIGVDIGDNFTRLSSVEFGYQFYYYPDGLQIMMPNQTVPIARSPDGGVIIETDRQGNIIVEPFFEPQKFFGTPQITFIFGRLW